jgi:hypothetical protein
MFEVSVNVLLALGAIVGGCALVVLVLCVIGGAQ